MTDLMDFLTEEDKMELRRIAPLVREVVENEAMKRWRVLQILSLTQRWSQLNLNNKDEFEEAKRLSEINASINFVIDNLAVAVESASDLSETNNEGEDYA